MGDSLTRTFSKYVCPLTYADLPAAVVDKIKASLLHALIVSIVGADTSHGKAAIVLTKEEESKADGATILVDGAKVTRAGAAFANSKLMHATNQTDSYRMLIHPGPCVIPAALASAELSGADGRQFITALAAAYEVEARIAGDFIPATQARGFRSSPIYGTLGATMATGLLTGLDEDQMVTALALACTFTGGTNEGPRGGGREMMYHEPVATRNGIMAALLAKENLRGSEMSLEGDAGFYNAFTGNNNGELTYSFGGPLQTSFENVVADLGDRWELMHVTPKIYPTAGYNCPVIELMTQLRASDAMPPTEIESITVNMNWLETLYPSPAFPNPQRGNPGVGSTHYFTAYTCVHGSYPPLRDRIDPGDPTSPNDQQVSDLMLRVKVVGEKDRGSFAPRITVVMRDGTQYQGEFGGDELKWDMAMETKRIRELFSGLHWPINRLEAIVEEVAGLDKQPNVNSLILSCVGP